MMGRMPEVSYEGRDLEALAAMPNYYAWIMETFAPYVRGRTIEYGAGTGTVSGLLAPLADTLTLIEPSHLASRLKSRFCGDIRIEVRDATLETHVATVADDSVDTIVLINVLEHIEDDRNALAQLLRAVKPGGHVLLFVPALQFLMSELDRVHGHFRRYHRPDLVSKIASAGGEVLACRYFDLPGVVPWLLINKIGGATGFNPRLVQLFDRLVVPVARALEGVVPPPFGKNVILVARKNAIGPHRQEG
jgi:SAM-dependent methyltransferase